jgi:nucleotide-binding universal stress UspA family protein
MALTQLRILVPIDGSEHSKRTVRYAVRLKDRLRQPLEVMLLNVQPPVPTKDLLLDARLSEVRHLEEPIKAHAGKLLEESESALKAAGIECHPYVEFGEPAAVISDFARTYHCEMIVMGTHGLSALAGLFLGSVANKVMHLAPVPVVLVP